MKTIAWDVDDTLNGLMRLWLEKSFLPRNKRCSVVYAGLTANPPHKILGLSLAAYQRAYDAFRLSGCYDALLPRKEVAAWFRRHGAKYRHIAVTAVPLPAAHKSAGWVYRHFGCWIRTFHVVPTPRAGQVLPRYDATKADFIRSIGGCDIFIDDNPENIRQVKATGAGCLLVPAPWNEARGDIAALLRSIK